MSDKATELRDIFLKRLHELEAEERQLTEMLERTRTARIAQEGAVTGMKILLEQLEEEKQTNQ